DNLLRLWDVEAGKELRQLQGPVHEFDAVAWSPDDRWLATAGSDHVACLWDPEGVRPPRLVGGVANPFSSSVAFSPDGRTLVTGVKSDAGLVRFWEVVSCQLRGVFPGNNGSVHAAVFAPDGGRVAAAGSNYQVLIWDVTRVGGGPAKKLA